MQNVRAVFCALFVLLAVLCAAEGQAPAPAGNALSLNLFMTAGGLLRNLPGTRDLYRAQPTATACIPLALEYERLVADHLVLAVAPMLVYYRVNGYDGLTIDQVVAVEWHPFDTGLLGWFFGAFIDFDYFTYFGSASSLTVFGIGPSVGYERAIGDRLVFKVALGVGMGPQYYKNVNGFLGQTNGWSVAFPLRSNIGLGFRF
jgi:hypothetical protein